MKTKGMNGAEAIQPAVVMFVLLLTPLLILALPFFLLYKIVAKRFEKD